MAEHTDVSLPPEDRVRALTKKGSSVDVNEDIPPRRYFRSGVEMIRMANTYTEEGNAEHAFVLYNKYITLFIEKLPKHRDYKTANIPEKKDTLKVPFQILTVFYTPVLPDSPILVLHGWAVWGYWRTRVGLSGGTGGPGLGCLGVLEDQGWAVWGRQELEKERQRILQEFHAPGSPPPDAPLLPGIQGPPLPLAVGRENMTVHDGLLSVLCPDTMDGMVDGIRQLAVPSELCSSFLRLADSNTSRAVETCGILCGKLLRNAFTVTHVIVPKQNGGPDYCDTENEEELFLIQDQYDLITLGWIHVITPESIFTLLGELI
uniref:STAM binding protein n=1 Tax=Hucho hucho TaxID=62062 RepID=A0A4W5Q6K3_9TELE